MTKEIPLESLKLQISALERFNQILLDPGSDGANVSAKTLGVIMERIIMVLGEITYQLDSLNRKKTCHHKNCENEEMKETN